MREQDQDDTPLPGLEPAAAGSGRVTEAAHRSLTALAEAELLGESHAVMAAALLATANQLDRATSSAKAKDYAVAGLVAQLRETWSALMPEATDGGPHDAFDQLAADLRAAAMGSAGSSAPVRDPA